MNPEKELQKAFFPYRKSESWKGRKRYGSIIGLVKNQEKKNSCKEMER